MSLPDLHGERDAGAWAGEFLRLNRERGLLQGDEVDLDVMRAWFANAIESSVEIGRAQADAALAEQDPARDVVSLLILKRDDDARTIEEMIEQDDHPTIEIERVVPAEDGSGWTISWDHGVTAFFRRPDGDLPEPAPGDALTIFGGADLGSTRYGWALNGRVAEYLTPWERFAKRMELLAEIDRRRRERLARERENLDRTYEGLPGPLKDRIDRFREDPGFRLREGYEMMAVGDAPRIARAVAEEHGWALDEDLRAEGVTEEEIAEAVRGFYDLDSAEQRKLVPDLSEGHTGNTFGGACSLALGLLLGREL